MRLRTISIVAPCYNEEAVLSSFYERLSAVACGDEDREYAFVFVNDGSADETPNLLNDLAQKDPRVKVIHLARNFGHQMALTAGVDFARGDAVVTIDVDLQDPPECIPALLTALEGGADIAHARRKSRDGESFFKLHSAALFYKVMRWCGAKDLVANVGDFRAFTQEVACVFRKYREPHRLLRGLFASMGYRQAVVDYARDSRFAGSTHYPLVKMLRLALNALVSFSAVPLHAIIWLAIACWGVSIIYLVHALYQRFINQTVVPGWTSLVILLVFFSGIQLFCTGVVGLYVGKIFEQGQRRPLYTVGSLVNFNRSETNEE